MKTFLKIILPCFLIFSTFSCESDNEQLVDLTLPAPSNLGATFQITQDNSGLVTIIPTGQGAVLYNIDFGDGSPVAENVRVGERIEHVYPEGSYEVVIIGKNLAGETAQGIQPLQVSFLAPTNLEAEIVQDPSNSYKVTVSASAENAAMFHVYFGEAEDEEPVPLMIGESVEHIYSETGTYEIKVVALSGGAATAEVVKEVVITDPLLLPIDFESLTKNYAFTNFGGGEGAGAPIVDNPEKNEVNSSDRVASYTKVSGSEVWAGTTIALAEPVDFSTEKYFSMDVYSPIEGAQILLKLENLEDPNTFIEATATTTKSGEWENLIFDFSTVDLSKEYGRIVVFFNFGVSGTGETYYFDNIETTTLEKIKLPLTFESEDISYNWAGFGGATGSVVENPHPEGINTSSKVTELVKSSGAQTWAGISLNLDEPLNTALGTNIGMKVWSPEAGVPILLKFEDSNSAPDANGNPSVFVEVIQNTTKSEEWEQLSFDLSSSASFDPNAVYDRVIVFYDFGNPGEGTSFYFDDIKAGDTKYISLFSDFGSDVAVDTWRTSWSAADYEEVNFDGRLTKHYFNLDFVGIETVANPIDASEMTHFHTDFYTDNATIFRVKLVNFGPDGAFGGGDDTEHEVIIEDPVQNEWVSLDIPLSQFENLGGTANIAQIIYSAAPAGEANVYIDNVYFHN